MDNCQTSYDMKKTCAWEFRTFGCRIETRINTYLTKEEDRTETGYYVGTTATKAVIRYWKPEQPKTIHYCVTAQFFEYTTKLPNGELSPGSALTQGQEEPSPPPQTTINLADHPFIKSHLIYSICGYLLKEMH